MLDRFDLALLDAAQCDDSKTAADFASDVPLSPSAIARRLRRLRNDGWISRTIAMLSPRLLENRLRALVFVQLSEHADQRGKTRLVRRIIDTSQVQFCYEVAGAFDLLLLFDCLNMVEFNELAEGVLVADSTVRRYETSFVKRNVKFAPFVQLSERSVQTAPPFDPP
jgi:Lrp/AsnC family leucine-responsive transcriptional regulator